MSVRDSVGVQPPIHRRAQMPRLPCLFLEKTEVVSVSSHVRVSPRLGYLGVDLGIPVVLTQLYTFGEGPKGGWTPSQPSLCVSSPPQHCFSNNDSLAPPFILKFVEDTALYTYNYNFQKRYTA